MDIKVLPSKLNGVIQMPSSKSMAHRALIASFLSFDKTLIEGRLVGRDVQSTLGVLQALGACVQEISSTKMNFSSSYQNIGLLKCGELPHHNIEIDSEVEYTKKKFDTTKNDKLTLNCGESGSTLRFMLPIVAALNINAQFVLEGRLSERPIADLIDAVECHGVCCKKDGSMVSVTGQLESGNFQIDGSVSSQYITGLLFALPLLDGDSTLTISGDLVSPSYINLTLETLDLFKINIDRNGNIFKVKGGQKYISPKQISIEGDWSTACFFAVGGALLGSVVLLGLDSNSRQGDKVVVELLEKMGAKIEIAKKSILASQSELQGVKVLQSELQGVKVLRSELHGIEFSCADCPDIVPIMSIACSCAGGSSKIFGVDRLRGKECDRLLATIENLSKMGVDCSFQNDCLTIVGGSLTGAKLSSFNDHRMAMSATIAGFLADGETEISDAQCVDKSFGDFFDEVRKLGGICNEVEKTTRIENEESKTGSVFREVECSNVVQ